MVTLFGETVRAKGPEMADSLGIDFSAFTYGFALLFAFKILPGN